MLKIMEAGAMIGEEGFTFQSGATQANTINLYQAVKEFKIELRV